MARTRGGFRPSVTITKQGGKIRRMNGRFYLQPATLSFQCSTHLAVRWQRPVTARVELEVQECLRTVVDMVHTEIEGDESEGSYLKWAKSCLGIL